MSASPRVFRGLAGGLLFCLLIPAFVADAAEWQVPPGKGTLQSAIDAASDGDSLLLGAGTYSGSVDVHRSLVLSGTGDGSSIVDGEGSSHVILVSAPDVTISGLNLHHSGEVAEDENSGIFITDKGARALIQGNHLQDNLIGVYLKGPQAAIVRNNV
ncbi:MAG: nitrous oxide reductase family maturation protein NosD, partial [Gammaproteobacteria bacterium]|nr:nitrous oxide reductase family maturation protein NosD [Gammaproteobacteria bacterium]